MENASRTRWVGCVLSAAIVLGAGLPAHAQLGGLKDILKKGKKLADKTKKDDEKKDEKADEATQDAPKAGKPAGGGVVFSKAPVNLEKPADLTNTFKAGDRIYAGFFLADTFAALAEQEEPSKLIIEVKCWLDGKYHGRGSFNITLRKDAVNKKALAMGVAPDPGKMNDYDDPNVAYRKQFDALGKRGGPMQLTMMLSKLMPGKHTVKLQMYRYKVYAEGEFTVEGDFAPYKELFKQLDEANTQTVKLPEAKKKDPKLEAEMVAALKASQVKEAKEGEVLKVIIIDPDWHLERHKISGRVLFRYIRTEVALQEKDGPCWLWRFVFKQDFIGEKFQKTKLHGIGERKKIPRKNVASAK